MRWCIFSVDALFSSISALALSGAALAAKVSALILAIAPYLFWIVLAVAAVVLACYVAKVAAIEHQKTIAKADAKIKKIVTPESKARYWTATIRGDYVDIGRELTFKEAVEEVKAGRNVFTVTWREAAVVAYHAGGKSSHFLFNN